MPAGEPTSGQQALGDARKPPGASLKDSGDAHLQRIKPPPACRLVRLSRSKKILLITIACNASANFSRAGSVHLLKQPRPQSAARSPTNT
jgi:hypothetical protein